MTEPAGKVSTTVDEFPRKLSLLDATMINVGSMIGSGIFIVPATVAALVPSSSMVMLVWILGGIVSMFGALAIAELGALMPRAGGQYVYLREAYNPLFGFLYGWTAFLVINTGSIAAIAVTFATYVNYFLPLDPAGTKLVAIASVILLTIINCFGIRIGAIIQNGFTLLKILALVLLALLAFVAGGGNLEHFSPILPTSPLGSLAGPFALALIAALFAYDSWIEVTYVAGEVKDPNRNLPRSLFISTLIVITLYLLTTLGVMTILGIEGMGKAPLVASDAAVRAVGPIGAMLVSIAVIVSTFGANNGFIFTCPRLYFAMAKEGLFFKWLAYVNPKYQTPIPSLIVQALLSCGLILSGTFDQLATYVVFASFFFYAMSAGAVIVLRKRNPDARRPYSTWGYPVTPVVFILFAMYLVGATIAENPIDATVGLGIILTGVPAYFYWKSRKSLS